MTKLLIIQENSAAYGVSKQDLITYWKDKLNAYPEIDYTIVEHLPRPLTTKGLDELVADYDGLIGVYPSKGLFTDELFEHHPRLKYCATNSHGYEGLDLDVIKRHNITFTNTLYGNTTIAQYAMALLLEICHHVSRHHTYTTKEYQDGMPFMKLFNRHIELYGKTVGIIGAGAIGQCFANMVHGFGCKVLAYDKYPKASDFIEYVDLDTLFKNSDIISLHCPLNEGTKHLINKDNIAKMKQGAILINTARGGLVDEVALYEALLTKKLYAAGLDVISEEPPKSHNPLFDLDNCIITSHIAWLSDESRYRSIDIEIENFINYLNGHPTSIVK